MNMAPPPSFAEFQVLHPYNPWWQGHRQAFGSIPEFRRDVFDELYQDVRTLPQMISVTGPRRVGKSTLLLQCIQQLVKDAADPQAQAHRIVYFSMDDPALELPGIDRDPFFNALMATANESARHGPTYLFLDEIQRFARWELYLKKIYDLKTAVRLVVSGSASTPIFRKSRESLLGRIKGFHVLPFTFREWWACPDTRHVSPSGKPAQSVARALRKTGQVHQRAAAPNLVKVLRASHELDRYHDEVERYLFEGGFPEVWNLPSLLAKQEYLYQNQVERVIFEDLLVAAEFRKPEMLRRFYLGLLKDPGRETNLSQLSGQIELARSTIETYFPLLEATDLVWRLHKHTSTKATPKAGNFKTYLVDLAVRNAVMKLDLEHMRGDQALMGYYAENCVANHLRRWPGLVELGYWRRNDEELDFIVDFGSARIGVEVKYRKELQEKEVVKAARLAGNLGCDTCVVVGRSTWAQADAERISLSVSVPTAVTSLASFLMLF